MADAAVVTPTRFSAFISYSHSDAVHARWLHRRIETYRLPRRLHTGSRLRPAFYDRAELRAAADLDGELREALMASEYLIVVCSPAATKSDWVAREIELFRDMRGDANILAALFEGDRLTAFPAPLRNARGGGPLAADFRQHGDGKRLGVLKLVSRLADVPLDALIQRDAHRRARVMAVVAGVAVAIALAMSALTVMAIRARTVADTQRNKAEAMVEFMVTDLRKRLKGVGKLELLTAVNRQAIGYYSGEDLAKLPPASLERRAALLQAMGEDDEKRGDLPAARRQWEEARRTTAALLAAAPNDPKRVFAHSQSEYWVAFAAWRGGDLPGAREHFLSYARLTGILLRLAPNDRTYTMEQGSAFSNLGTFTMRALGQPAVAERQFRVAQSAYEALARLQPGDSEAQIQLADGFGWIGDSQRLQGRFADARASRGQQRAILDRLLADDPANLELRGSMVGNALANARIELAAGNARAAIRVLNAAKSEAVSVARADRENKEALDRLHLIALVEVAAWLTLPAKLRPADLAASTNFCAGHSPGRGDEVLAWCRLLRAQLILANAAELRKLANDQTTRIGRYSATWGIDFNGLAYPII